MRSLLLIGSFCLCLLSSGSAASAAGVDVAAGGCSPLTLESTGDGLAPSAEAAGIGDLWVSASVDADYRQAISVFSADIDADGDRDLVGAGFFDSEVRWWENAEGDGSVWTPHVVDEQVLNAEWIVAADIDGDGDTDLAGAINGTSDLVWWKNLTSDGLTWERRVIDAALGGAEAVAVGDIDGDGDPDLTAVGWVSGEVAWYQNLLGTGQFWSKRTVSANFGGAEAITNADIDDDGDLDIVASGVSRGIAMFENVAGDGSVWSGRPIADDDGMKAAVFPSDIDGDGDLDILGASSTGDRIAWWENVDGQGFLWVDQLIDASIPGPKSIAAADIDRDGDPDVYTAASSGNAGEVSWWENLGGGLSWEERSVDPDFPGAWTTFAADLDGDGDLDLATSATIADEVRWFENRAVSGCPPGMFETGSLIALTASPDPANGIAAWSGTDDDDSTIRRNFLTMPALPATVSVDYIAGCEDVVRVAFGPGSPPLVSPEASAGCIDGRFVAGEELRLISQPDPGGRVDEWQGSQVDIENNELLVNSIVVPPMGSGVVVSYNPDCFILRTVAAGEGGAPVPDPTGSQGCAAGEFRFGTVVTVTANPAPGFEVARWLGTDDDTSTELTNTVTVPEEARLTGVLYVLEQPGGVANAE